MKSYKLFQICYTGNLIMCLAIIGFRAYIVFTKTDINSNILTSFIIVLIITSLFATFDWFCHALILSIKNDIPLSNKTIKKGKIYRNLCLFLSGIFCLAIIVKVIDSEYRSLATFYDIKGYPLWYCFLTLFITTFYLSIYYGLKLRDQKIITEKTLESIGKED